ncbi:MAG TPA: EamA family transporter RarD [Steroidobacteraceae bacterium]|nr:EamA family transporter RarD [Steroidobacteraceae bacterium]
MSKNPPGSGVPAAVTAYFLWGLFPLYWSLLSRVPIFQVLAHRAFWCALVVWLYLAARGEARWWRGLSARSFWMLVASSALISVNWSVYIYGVNTGHVLDTSLGYFINPLVNVVLGVLLLRERLSPLQWLAVACAAFGVGYLTVQLGALPWIALTLALSFGGYGLIRKLVAVDAVHGLALESAVLVVPAIVYLAWCMATGTGAFLHEAPYLDLLIVFGGVLTSVPMALFAYGARRVSMTLLGILQYMAPTVALLIGVLVFHEPFGPVQAVAFGCIWLALAIFALDGLRRLFARPVTVPPPE